MEENKVFSKSVLMKDGTEQSIEATRNDMEAWLKEHRKAKYICPDDKELFERYAHLYEICYNKTHPKPKGTRGGAREGAGRKPKGVTERLHYGWRVSRDVWEILQRQDNKTDFIESAIRAYDRAMRNRRGDGY